MAIRCWWKEMLGMVLYQTESGEYFYAWGGCQALKKEPNTQLYVINDYGEKCKVAREIQGGYIAVGKRGKEFADKLEEELQQRKLDIILQLIVSGVARIERSQTTDLVEFCFNGIRYPCNDCDWNELLTTIGQKNIDAAIQEIKKV